MDGPLLLPLPLPSGLTARGAGMHDAAAALAVTRAAEQAEGPAPLTVLEDIVGDWSRPSMDITQDVLLVEEDGSVVAYAEEFDGRAFAHVHPDAQGRGIGTALAAWSEEHARRAGRVRVGQTVLTTAARARDLLVRRGYDPLWDSWILRLALDGPPAASPVPTGVTLRRLRRPDDERELHAVIEEAFGTWPDRDTRTSFDDWRASHLDRVPDPDLVVVAEEGGRLVGGAVCGIEEGEGWVDQLAVLPAAWGRGIGGALLRTAFQRFHDRGLATAALSTDSRTGALRLYEHAGMEVTETFVRYSLDLDPARRS